MQINELAKYIDHSLLQPDVTLDELKAHCRTAVSFEVYSVAINSFWVEKAVKCLDGTGVLVGSSVGFPLGQIPSHLKIEEAKMALEAGAREVDMVMNIGAFKSGDYNLVRDEIRAIDELAGEHIIKVILETGLLTDEQKEQAAHLAIEAGADFIKTSTGFGGIPGANVHDVELLKKAAAGQAKVKAAGGMISLDRVLAMIEAGAERIGTKYTVEILEELERRNSEN
jgi:deoxyribose-phosphate aldolase